MEVEGPLTGPLAVFSELLHAAFFLAIEPRHHVADTYRERRPGLVALAERLRLNDHAAAPLDEVLTRIWDELSFYA
jgi:hypothetical protein